jgi:hypothetical protein
MMKATYPLALALLALAILLARASADDSQATPSDSGPEKFTLRYNFHPGESIRWEVLQQARVRTTVSGTTQVADTVSKSVKVWRVTEVERDGTATFEHLVEPTISPRPGTAAWPSRSASRSPWSR